MTARPAASTNQRRSATFPRRPRPQNSPLLASSWKPEPAARPLLGRRQKPLGRTNFLLTCSQGIAAQLSEPGHRLLHHSDIPPTQLLDSGRAAWKLQDPQERVWPLRGLSRRCLLLPEPRHRPMPSRVLALVARQVPELGHWLQHQRNALPAHLRGLGTPQDPQERLWLWPGRRRCFLRLPELLHRLRLQSRTWQTFPWGLAPVLPVLGYRLLHQRDTLQAHFREFALELRRMQLRMGAQQRMRPPPRCFVLLKI